MRAPKEASLLQVLNCKNITESDPPGGKINLKDNFLQVYIRLLFSKIIKTGN